MYQVQLLVALVTIFAYGHVLPASDNIAGHLDCIFTSIHKCTTMCQKVVSTEMKQADEKSFGICTKGLHSKLGKAKKDFAKCLHKKGIERCANFDPMPRLAENPTWTRAAIECGPNCDDIFEKCSKELRCEDNEKAAAGYGECIAEAKAKFSVPKECKNFKDVIMPHIEK